MFFMTQGKILESIFSGLHTHTHSRDTLYFNKLQLIHQTYYDLYLTKKYSIRNTVYTNQNRGKQRVFVIAVCSFELFKFAETFSGIRLTIQKLPFHFRVWQGLLVPFYDICKIYTYLEQLITLYKLQAKLYTLFTISYVNSKWVLFLAFYPT